MQNVLTGLVVLAVVFAIFATTKAGRRLVSAIGLDVTSSGAATSEDVDFLLGRCGHDAVEVARRIAFERERFPELCEAEHYRRAIRRLLGEANAGTGSRPGAAAPRDPAPRS